jgi:hypothetical protein
VHYGDFHFREIEFSGNRTGSTLPFTLEVYNTRIGDEISGKCFKNIKFSNTLYGDTLKIGLTVDAFFSIDKPALFDSLSIKASLTPLDTLYRLAFDNSTLHFFNDKWSQIQETTFCLIRITFILTILILKMGIIALVFNLLITKEFTQLWTVSTYPQ